MSRCCGFDEPDKVKSGEARKWCCLAPSARHYEKWDNTPWEEPRQVVVREGMWYEINDDEVLDGAFHSGGVEEDGSGIFDTELAAWEGYLHWLNGDMADRQTLVNECQKRIEELKSRADLDAFQ